MFRAATAFLLAVVVGLCAAMPDPDPHDDEGVLNLFGARYRVNHAACAVTAVAGVGAATFGVPALLTAIGFGPIGIIGGSLAAAVQSYFGVVSAGGVFATLQSYAMLGGAPSVVAQATIAAALYSGCLVAQN